ncbi:MAG: glycosyltransferase family 2 protein [Verrucomicrobiales bacterium]
MSGPAGSAPLVSVLIPTFNHERFLARAIESALAQITDFRVEILVGNDASTDNTGNILKDLASRHPDRIRAFHAETNAGGHANFSQLYAAAHGQYIALLEGDDYWTDPGKLQTQIDHLAVHPECSLCFHQVEIRDEIGDLPATISNPSDPLVSGLSRITRFNYIHTPSVVFRNRLIPGVPAWVHSLPMGDWPLFVLLAEHGELHLIRKPMAVYRVQSGSVWASRTQLSRLVSTVHVAEVCVHHLGHPGFRDCIFKTSRTIARMALAERAPFLWLRHAMKCARMIISQPELRRSLFSPGKKV